MVVKRDWGIAKACPHSGPLEGREGEGCGEEEQPEGWTMNCFELHWSFVCPEQPG